MTDQSSALPPRFLADRCLGRITVRRLRERGWDIVQLSDVYDDDAQAITDEEWLGYAGRHGYPGITKDKRIRHQPAFNRASTPVFVLSDGGLPIDEMVERFDMARGRIWANARNAEREFWVVYSGGRVERRWP